MPSPRVHVVAGAIVDGDKVLVARRPQSAHQGGRWEFPGGKLEAQEEPRSGLVRELEEELRIKATQLRPLIRIPHDYEDRPVSLDVWRVDGWQGEPRGAEGQAVEWVSIAKLKAREFPAANRSIITAIRLPGLYYVTPEPADTPFSGLRLLQDRLRQGVGLVQLRSKKLKGAELRRLVRQCAALCVSYGAILLVNSAPELARDTEAMGVHLTAERLLSLHRRPLDENHWVAASCHNLHELEHACRVGVDFVVLSPVCPTASHPGAEPLGWERFGRLVSEVTVPVYALGGVKPADTPIAWQHGAQGIAAISGFEEQA